MVGIYVLMALVSLFAPHSTFSAPRVLQAPSVLAAPVQMGPAFLAVQFQQLNGVSVGAPVLVDGHLVGSVSKISEKSSSESNSAYTVQVDINPTHRGLMKEGVVGLITSPLAGVRAKPQTVIEFLLPEKSSGHLLKEGAFILGFSSLVEFWSSDSADHVLPKTNS